MSTSKSFRQIFNGLILFTTVFSVYFVQPNLTKADTLQDLQNTVNSLNKSKNNKAQSLQDKQRLASQLQTEINNLNNSIQATQHTINTINHDINTVKGQIETLNSEIQDQTNLIEQEKLKLDDAISDMYIDSATYSPLLALAQNNISDSIAVQQNYQAVETAIQDKANQIEQLKAQLEQQKTDLTKKQNGLQVLQDQQVQQQRALNSQKVSQSTLLADTNANISQLASDINQINQQIKAVDGRISDLIAALDASKGYAAASGDLVVVNSQLWHYYQTDSRWGGQSLNPSYPGSDTIAESGCLVTAITMVANRYGFSGTPSQILSKLLQAGAMYNDLVAWGNVSGAFGGKLDFTAGKESINWHVVDAYLAQNKPVIVGIQPPGYGTVIHWIVIASKVGDKYGVEDPYYSSGRVYPASWITRMARLEPQ